MYLLLFISVALWLQKSHSSSPWKQGKPHTLPREPERKYDFFLLLFFSWQSMRELFCSATLLWVWTWVCMCFPCGPIWFEFSPDLAESASLLATDGFTWPCPRPRPFRFYPSGMPISASLSSAPATRNKAPEGGQKGRIWKHFLSTCNFYFQTFKKKGHEGFQSHVDSANTHTLTAALKRQLMIPVAIDIVLDERARERESLDRPRWGRAAAGSLFIPHTAARPTWLSSLPKY